MLCPGGPIGNAPVLPVRGYWINRNHRTSQLPSSQYSRRRQLATKSALPEFSIYTCTGLRTCLGAYVDPESGLAVNHCNHHYNRTTDLFSRNPVAGNFACCAATASNASLLCSGCEADHHKVQGKCRSCAAVDWGGVACYSWFASYPYINTGFVCACITKHMKHVLCKAGREYFLYTWERT